MGAQALIYLDTSAEFEVWFSDRYGDRYDFTSGGVDMTRCVVSIQKSDILYSIDSDDYPSYFDWDTDGATGGILFDFGALNLDPGHYSARVVGFWAARVNGEVLADAMPLSVLSALSGGVDPTRSSRWNDIPVNFQGVTPIGGGGGSNDPSWEAIKSGVARYGWNFSDEAVEGQEKLLPYGVQVPHSVDEDSEFRFHIHFITGARVPSGYEKIRFEIQLSTTNVGDVLESRSTVEVDVQLPLNCPAYTHLAKGLITVLAGHGIEVSADLGGTIRRKSSHANDTYEDDIHVIHADPHVKFSSLGSIDEYPGA